MCSKCFGGKAARLKATARRRKTRVPKRAILLSMKEKRLKRRARALRLFPWICTGLIVGLIYGSMYTVMQQDLRLGANDPQIQLAQDAAAQLTQGKSKAAVLPTMRVDLDKSLAPAVIIYGSTGRPLAGNGYIGGSLPDFPRGALQSNDATAYHAVTWQPNKNLRLAVVIVKAGDNYVLSARSLAEVERRASLL